MREVQLEAVRGMPRGNCNHRRDKNAVLLKSMDLRDSEIEMVEMKSDTIKNEIRGDTMTSSN